MRTGSRAVQACGVAAMRYARTLPSIRAVGHLGGGKAIFPGVPRARSCAVVGNAGHMSRKPYGGGGLMVDRQEFRYTTRLLLLVDRRVWERGRGGGGPGLEGTVRRAPWSRPLKIRRLYAQVGDVECAFSRFEPSTLFQVVFKVVFKVIFKVSSRAGRYVAASISTTTTSSCGSTSCR